MTKDISFTTNEEGPLLMPLTYQGECTGAQVLMQKVVVIMLTSTDDPLREAGGGLYDNLKSANVSENSLERLNNIINISIANTVEIIQDDQATLTDLPDDERLSSISLSNLSIPAVGSLEIELTIISASGEQSIAALNLEV